MKQKNEMKRKKRANGEGCIYLRKDGRWEARITDGYNLDGSQHWKTFSSKKQSIVIEKLNKYKKEKGKFNNNVAVKYTVKEWLNAWYNDYVINNVKLSTRTSYEGIINNHLITNIGHIKLVDLNKTHIENMYNKLLTSGKNGDLKQGLSIKTIKNIHLVLHEALKDALEREYIIKNPASISNVPTMKSLNTKKKEIEIYSREEQEKLLKVASEDKVYGIVVIFALHTGMRKGEILGLQWDDIDFENRTININKQLQRTKNYDNNDSKKTTLQIINNTKTENSTRKIPMLDSLVIPLKQHYTNQQKWKLFLGKKYYNNNLVFCREDGSPLDPDTVLSKYKELSKKANIKECTFHALRHTFATRALESKMQPKVVSQILGHSTVQFTLDTYTHVLPELQTSEMNKLDNYLNSMAI